MVRVAFIDPASGDEFKFAFNPSAQDTGARTRTVKTLPPTAAGWKPCTPTLSQGDRVARKLRFSGLAPTPAEHELLTRFLALSATQSVIFRDPTGDELEVIVTAFEPTRKAVVKGPKGGIEVWGYTLEMELLNT